VKLVVLQIAKRLGLFSLTRWLTASGLRILCYHGFELSDEAAFRPKLFMKPQTFQRRMAALAKGRFHVLSLSDALHRLRSGTLPRSAVAITIDDGFVSTRTIAAPRLKQHKFPATVYVTTYYVVKTTPIFRLVVQYMFWRTTKKSLILEPLTIEGVESPVDLGDISRRNEAMTEIIRHGETKLSEPERQALLASLAEKLGIDFARIVESRSLSLMTERDLRELLRLRGFDLQLHTHRHSLSLAEVAVCRREIEENRRVLEPLADEDLRHFCYPSGAWSPALWPLLKEMRVESAATCEPGLNYRRTPLLGLKRFLDGENISQIEFEAEVYGFLEAVRRFRALFAHARGASRFGVLSGN
jgi:peptidoglycan/xylan/chitin deacetylase (PgdA/CDA1 family)